MILMERIGMKKIRRRVDEKNRGCYDVCVSCVVGEGGKWGV